MRSIIILFITVLPFLLQAEGKYNGEELFQFNCKACHTIDKKVVGPALMDVHKRRDDAWLHKFIKSSQSLIKSGDATAVGLFEEYNKVIMPDQPLNDEQITSILDYVKLASTQIKSKVDDNPIKRPHVYKADYEPLHFNNFFQWITYTITVLLLIFVLYYLTILADFRKKRKEGEQL